MILCEREPSDAASRGSGRASHKDIPAAAGPARTPAILIAQPGHAAEHPQSASMHGPGRGGIKPPRLLHLASSRMSIAVPPAYPVECDPSGFGKSRDYRESSTSVRISERTSGIALLNAELRQNFFGQNETGRVADSGYFERDRHITNYITLDRRVQRSRSRPPFSHPAPKFCRDPPRRADKGNITHFC